MKHLVAGILIALVALVVYWDSLECGFVYDDRAAIKDSKDVKGETEWKDLLYNDFWGKSMDSVVSHKSYRPITVATFRINHDLEGLEPRGFHFFDIVFHAIATFFIFLLAEALFQGDLWRSVVAGLLFALHPIHTESVCNNVGRADLLCAIFVVPAFLAYLRAASPTTGSGFLRSTAWMLVVQVLMFCGFLCKEVAVTLPAVCVTYDFCYIVHRLHVRSNEPSNDSSKNGRNGSKAYAEENAEPTIGRYLLGTFLRVLILTATTLSYIYLRIYLAGTIFSPRLGLIDNPVSFHPDRHVRWMSYAHLHAYYLWLLVYPFTLSADYSFDCIPLVFSPQDYRNIFSVVAYIIVFGFAFYVIFSRRLLFRDRLILMMSLAWGVATFLPSTNIVFPVGTVIGERLLYLPSIGFCLFAANWLRNTILRPSDSNDMSSSSSSSSSPATGSSSSSSSPTRKMLFIFVVSAIMASYTARVHTRIPDWISDETLHRANVASCPESSRAHISLGTALMKTTGDKSLGTPELKRAAEILSRASAWLTVDTEDTEQKKKAEDYYSDYHSMLGQYGGNLMELGHTQEAIDVFHRGLELPDPRKSKKAKQHTNLAILYRDLDQIDTALEHAKMSLHYDSNLFEGWQALSVIYGQLGQFDKALDAISTALEIQPGSVGAMKNTVVLLITAGEPEMAERRIQHFVSSMPSLSSDPWWESQLQQTRAMAKFAHEHGKEALLRELNAQDSQSKKDNKPQTNEKANSAGTSSSSPSQEPKKRPTEPEAKAISATSAVPTPVNQIEDVNPSYFNDGPDNTSGVSLSGRESSDSSIEEPLAYLYWPTMRYPSCPEPITSTLSESVEHGLGTPVHCADFTGCIAPTEARRDYGPIDILSIAHCHYLSGLLHTSKLHVDALYQGIVALETQNGTLDEQFMSTLELVNAMRVQALMRQGSSNALPTAQLTLQRYMQLAEENAGEGAILMNERTEMFELIARTHLRRGKPVDALGTLMEALNSGFASLTTVQLYWLALMMLEERQGAVQFVEHILRQGVDPLMLECLQALPLSAIDLISAPQTPDAVFVVVGDVDALHSPHVENFWFNSVGSLVTSLPNTRNSVLLWAPQTRGAVLCGDHKADDLADRAFRAGWQSAVILRPNMGDVLFTLLNSLPHATFRRLIVAEYVSHVDPPNRLGNTPTLHAFRTGTPAAFLVMDMPLVHDPESGKPHQGLQWSATTAVTDLARSVQSHREMEDVLVHVLDSLEKE